MNKGTYGYLTCSVQDYLGKSATVKVRVKSAQCTIGNASKLADYIKTHSDARVTTFGLSQDAKGDSTDAGKYDRVLQSLTYLYEDSEGQARRFSLPAPRDEDVNDDQEPVSDTAEDVKDLLNGFGLSIAVYNGGGLRSRTPKKEARSKKTTGA